MIHFQMSLKETAAVYPGGRTWVQISPVHSEAPPPPAFQVILLKHPTVLFSTAPTSTCALQVFEKQQFLLGASPRPPPSTVGLKQGSVPGTSSSCLPRAGQLVFQTF